MRELAEAGRIRGFMEALAAETRERTRAYFTGGATAVLLGWRASTIDVDVVFVPERDALLRALPALKERLRLNVELASPAHFIPVPRGWEDRGRFEAEIGPLTFFHFDLYAQALAKIERGHTQDVADVEEMVRRGLIDPAEALAYFGEIEPELYRFPAIDPASFRQAVERRFGPT